MKKMAPHKSKMKEKSMPSAAMSKLDKLAHTAPEQKNKSSKRGKK